MQLFRSVSVGAGTSYQKRKNPSGYGTPYSRDGALTLQPATIHTIPGK